MMLNIQEYVSLNKKGFVLITNLSNRDEYDFSKTVPKIICWPIVNLVNWYSYSVLERLTKMSMFKMSSY